MTRRRSVLFLQGMASHFFAALGRALAARGHAVHRVNFNAGDQLFWPLPNGIAFRGTPDAWPEFLLDVLHRNAITDIVLFGDCRPLHRAAITVARSVNIPVHVCEEGYIRPDWVVFEPDGVNGHSTLPRDPAWFHAEAAALPALPPMPPLQSSFRRRAVEDLMYNLSAIALSPAFPHFVSHRPRHRLLEYASWSGKVIRTPGRRRRSREQLARLAKAPGYFLMPLQLESDAQIRQHSRFVSMRAVLTETIGSFVRHAPAESILVIKEHPLDDGAVNWRLMVAEIAAAHRAQNRVLHVEIGSIDELVAGARGLVAVNSTTGTLALSRGIPVIPLGMAIYHIAGLTFQGSLDEFWTEAQPPDTALYAAFCRILAARCMLPGNFFSESGIALLVSHAVERLEAAPFPARLVEAAAAEPAGLFAGGLVAEAR